MTNKDFVTYEQASALKELGFDEPCIYAWCNKGGWNKYQMVKEPIVQVLRTDGNPFGQYFNGKNWNVEFSPNKNQIQCSAPTYSQAFRFFREKHNAVGYVAPTFDSNKIGHYTYDWFIKLRERVFIKDGDFKRYEEAETKCLDKLIQIVKDNGNNTISD